ncbi:MAG: hypothetical protein AAB131_01530, partial [Actinomycetota bacterium]
MLFQPAVLGAGSAAAAIEGGVRSILSVTVEDAVLAARSVALALKACPAPSAVAVIGDGQVSTPDRPSAQAYVIVTSVLFHPVALGAGATVGVIDGEVLSRLTVAEADAVF